MDSRSPIIVLDSGLGGLTVVRALRRRMPQENILYFGDTARVPYGTKTAATVTTFVRQIIRYLESHEPKHVVIACNTATALSLAAVRREFAHLSISGVIDPGARAAVGSHPATGAHLGRRVRRVDSHRGRRRAAPSGRRLPAPASSVFGCLSSPSARRRP